MLFQEGLRKPCIKEGSWLFVTLSSDIPAAGPDQQTRAHASPSVRPFMPRGNE